MRSLLFNFDISKSLNRILPLKEINFKIASIKEVFPDPDSPTIPNVWL